MLRNESYTNSLIYKHKKKKWHDVSLRGNKDFEVGQKVLLFNSRMKLFPGKLKTRWYEPFVLNEVFLHRAIDLIKDDGLTFKVNGHRLRNMKKGCQGRKKKVKM